MGKYNGAGLDGWGKEEDRQQKPHSFDGATFLYHAKETGANDMTCKGNDQENGKAGCYKGCGYLQQRRPKEKAIRKEEV